MARRKQTSQARPEAAATQDIGPLEGGTWAGSNKLPLLGIVAIVGAGIALSLGLLRDLNDFIAPTFLALNLLIAAYPIYTGLVKVKTPKVIAAVITGAAVFVLMLVGIGALVWSLTEMVKALGAYSAQFTELYVASVAWLGQFGFDQAALLKQLQSVSPTSVLDVVGKVVANLSSAGGLIVVVLCVIVFVVMDLPTTTQRLGVTEKLYPALARSIESLVVGIRRYWVVTTIFGLIVAAFDWLLLVILAVPLPLVWAVLSFITNYIPNVGFVIGLIPPALLAFFEHGWVSAVMVVAGYCVLNFVIQSIIQPKFTGDAVGVTAVVSFLSLLLWTWVLGPLGALVALPATLAVKALLIDPDPKLRWVSAFISNDPESIDTRKA